MKVNMTPNPLDVVTIHASQGDTEARQWEFELHNNGELIDTSSVTEQLFFKAYKGGTEQILPENTSTPTTSPFKGDIKYPQGLLTNQEFTYRQSPTEEDGLAKITDIKGNTLVWNQLIMNGNFADTSNWSAESGATLSISNNIATISSTTANNGIKQYFPIPLTVGHKYLIKAEFNVPTEYRCVIGTAANQGVQTDKLISTANTWTEVSGIGTCTVATTSFYCFVRGTTYENVKIRNVMCFDLTQMGLDIIDPSDFTSLFPLSYYAYNQGTLLSFMGNGIKTVSEDESEESTLSLPISTYFPSGMDGVPYSSSNPTIVYDELTDTKAIKRTNKVIYDGSNDENWQLQSINSYNIANFTVIIDDYMPSTMNSSKCNIFTSQVSAIAQTQTEGYFLTFDKRLYIRISSSKASTVEQFRTWLASNNIEFVYRLATPTETSFTTASLVTENAEIPLSNEDGVLVGKCTEELSAEPGFHDAKIKLADEDGECYSNKLQLHVERSPQ